MPKDGTFRYSANSTTAIIPFGQFYKLRAGYYGVGTNVSF
jgi:hypothetical protein